MCSPMAVMAATTIVSTGFTAVQQIRQGRFAEDVADYNARVAENQAQEVITAGVEEENIQRRKTAELLSRQRAQLGAAGVELETGSALQLQEDTLTLGEADALRIRSNVESRAGALLTGAELTRQQGQFAAQAGVMEGAGTILSGTAKTLDTGVADKWFTPNSAAVTIGSQTGFTGGAEGVLSGEEFRLF